MIWIDQQPTLDRAMQQVAAQPVVAVDTEADSLHSYFDKVCLIQMSIAGEDLVIDPLKKIDLKGFGDILANRSIIKVLHGADYDLRILNRDFGFTIGNLVDTMVCAQMLGYEAFGLGALLERHFGFKVDKSHQRADWAMRPLPPDMLEYATTDTRHLIELAGKLREELEEKGRWEWAQEEFARLEAIRFTEKDGDEEPFRRLKGLTAAEPRALAVIRNLYDWRDGLARKADRPPFKVIGNDVILELGRVKPMTLAELNNVKPLSGFHRTRYGKDLIRLVGEAMALPEESLPERVPTKPWLRDREIDNKVNRLKTVRDRVAKELKIDGSVVAPRHVLVAIAEGGTLDVPAMREWQKTLFGEELLAALKK